MKRELEFIRVQGFYGGSQSWFWDPLLKMGGCAAVTACEVSAYLAGTFPDMRSLYPFEIDQSKAITKPDFIQFGKLMKPHIPPRAGGVSKLSLYEDGFLSYVKTTGLSLEMDYLEGDEPYEKAEAFLKSKIDLGIAVPFLLLKHKDSEFTDYTWHWFTMTGYEEDIESLDFHAIFSTYGKQHKVSFRRLWETGYEEKGGMITVKK